MKIRLTVRGLQRQVQHPIINVPLAICGYDPVGFCGALRKGPRPSQSTEVQHGGGYLVVKGRIGDQVTEKCCGCFLAWKIVSQWLRVGVVWCGLLGACGRAERASRCRRK